MLVLGIAVTAIAAALFIYMVAIRPWHMQWGASHLDRVAQLPGDEISPRAPSHITHAIAIAAPPEAVWPLLLRAAQEQAKRAGMTIAVERPPQAVVLVTTADAPRVKAGDEAVDETRAFFLKSLAGGQTRLIARLRAAAFPGLATNVANFFFREPSHFLAERKLLLAVKAAAEKPS